MTEGERPRVLVADDPRKAAIAAYLRCRERLFTAATSSAGSTGLLMCV